MRKRRTLYHLTDRDVADKIVTEAFKDGPRGGVWLAKHPQEAIGEDCGTCILRVYLDVDPQELASYERIAEMGWALDPETDELVLDPESPRPFHNPVFYEIPAERLNSLIDQVVVMSDKERKRLMNL